MTRRPLPLPPLRAALPLGLSLPVLLLSGLAGRLLWAPEPQPALPAAPLAEAVFPILALAETTLREIDEALPDLAPRAAPIVPAARAPGAVTEATPDAAPVPHFVMDVAAFGLPGASDDTPAPRQPVAAYGQTVAATVAATPTPAATQPPSVTAAGENFAEPAIVVAEAATETAPVRSLLPVARPARLAAAPVAAVVSASLAGPETLFAARLPAPPARPDTVARRATADVVQVAAIAPQASLTVPALGARDTCPAQLTRAIPRRPQGAEGGRAAMARLASAGGTARDAAILSQLEAGNLPEHLRALVPVTLTGTTPTGARARITLCVTPDYLAVGHDRDFVRVPLGLPAAGRIAARFDMALPTARMVDAIHRQAQARLAPSPMTPGAQMASTDYFLRHNATIEGQRARTGAALGVLVSGHKKDLVLTNRLTRVSGRVAIYGWHRADGNPIQPLSTVHGANYADYSHGVRLVSTTAFVDGRPADLRDLLADRRYAAILSGDEGPIQTRQILAALR